MEIPMTARDIVGWRLANQQVSASRFTTVRDIVFWLGALQSQDYTWAKWAIGVRLQRATENKVERAIDDGLVIRMHLLRPTWHFVARDDVRWMLALTAPQIRASMRSRDRQLGITDDVVRRSNRVIARTLRGAGSVPRERLVAELEAAGMANRDNLAAHLLMRAETDQVACCSISRAGKQEYALFEERIPPAEPLKREEAIGRLAKRYFSSRWPATLQDFAWWSGLTLKDAKSAFEMVKSGFETEIVDSKTYVISRSLRAKFPDEHDSDLLPAYDEMILSYADREALLPRSRWVKAVTTNGIIKPLLVVKGQAVGTWSRTTNKEKVVVAIEPFRNMLRSVSEMVEKAAQRYAAFLGKAVEVRRVPRRT
jgi:hypothetical protein